ncbi:MAG: AGE family epimerase/isomerase [Ginsengibacter sp.]
MDTQNNVNAEKDILTRDDMPSPQQLSQFRNELQEELSRILDFWQQYTPDTEFGGFYGKLDNLNTICPAAPKGSVLNSRILWAFSAAYNLTGNEEYHQTAQTAFDYIIEHFIDKKYGGVYWSVDHKGDPCDTKKQIYALAFAIYGLAEYYKSTNTDRAKEMAIELYHLIVEHSYDVINGGYMEALSRDWRGTEDLRLSEKDANEKKSMNTHLHALEGFTNLYRVWPNEDLYKRIIELITIFLDHIIDKKSSHLGLFFDEGWTLRSNIVSYGHDIEAAWLIAESAEITGDSRIIGQVETQSINLANAAAEGLDNDGGLWYEYDADKSHLVKEKHSWPQAEAMIGFFNAWQITGDKSYFERSLESWQFVKAHILDALNGEWFWGVTETYAVMDEDKVGIWKCPYHNSRACIELIRRINKAGIN